MYIVDIGLTKKFKVSTTIKDAKELADENASWTGVDIKIKDETTGRTVARKRWYIGLDGIEKVKKPIKLLDVGYYGDWETPRITDCL